MGSTLTNLLYHIVFGTKDRYNLIQAELAPDLHSYIGGIIRGEKGALIAIGGTPNHVHILARLPASMSLSEAVRRIKGNSSKWMNGENRAGSRFAWQRGYGAFSVSESMIDPVAEYIAQQAEHHRRMTFEEEFVSLLRKHKVEFDDNLIWT